MPRRRIKNADPLEKFALVLSKKSEAEMDQAAETFVKMAGETDDLGYAREMWRMSLGLPKTGGALLPEAVFKRGLAAVAAKQTERNAVAQKILDKAVLDSAELVRLAIAQAKSGKLKGAMFNKAVETALKLLERQLGGGKGAADKRPVTAVQTNVNIIGAGNTQGMSKEKLGQFAAAILLDCGGPGQSSVDSLQPPDQGQAGESGTAPSEQSPG